MSEATPNTLGEPSEELKQQLVLLILDNVPSESEGSAGFVHPDGREFGLIRPSIYIDDPDYLSDDPLIKSDRLYSVFIEEPVVQDGKVTAHLSTGYQYDPLTSVVKKVDSSLPSNYTGLVDRVRSEIELESQGLKPGVDAMELQQLLDDVQAAISHTGSAN